MWGFRFSTFLGPKWKVHVWRGFWMYWFSMCWWQNVDNNTAHYACKLNIVFDFIRHGMIHCILTVTEQLFERFNTIYYLKRFSLRSCDLRQASPRNCPRRTRQPRPQHQLVALIHPRLFSLSWPCSAYTRCIVLTTWSMVYTSGS